MIEVELQVEVEFGVNLQSLQCRFVLVHGMMLAVRVYGDSYIEV